MQRATNVTYIWSFYHNNFIYFLLIYPNHCTIVWFSYNLKCMLINDNLFHMLGLSRSFPTDTCCLVWQKHGQSVVLYVMSWYDISILLWKLLLQLNCSIQHYKLQGWLFLHNISCNIHCIQLLYTISSLIWLFSLVLTNWIPLHTYKHIKYI